MTAVPVDRDPDNEVARLVALARTTHEQVNLTEDGDTVAVVMGAQEYAGLMETLDILSNPGEVEDILASRAELAAGMEIDGATILKRFAPTVGPRSGD